MRTRALAFALTLSLVAVAAEAQDRSLSWKALDVTARLGSDGELTVLERQTIVFDGAWNGGERVFRLGDGQQVRLISLRRVLASGEKEEMKLGSLAEVGNFGWSPGPTLRWRTRHPNDPPYRGEIMVTEIEYALTGVLVRDGDHYLLDHDFGIPDRTGPIDSFTVTMTVDPVWTSDPVPPMTLTNVPPGSGGVLHLPLQFTGTGVPAHVYQRPEPVPPPPPPAPPLQMAGSVRALAVAALLAGFGFLFFRFFSHERLMGRFKTPDQGSPTEDWLQRNVFAYPPEVIGASWDESSSESEVSAVLARLIQEGKIATRRDSIDQRMQLELKVPRGDFQEHERALIDALFVKGDVTDQATLRTHYRSQGFDPAAVLRAPLMRKAEEVTARAFGPPATVSCQVGVLLMAMLGITVLAGSFVPGWSGVNLHSFAFRAAVIFAASLFLAASYRSKLRGQRMAFAIAIPLFLLACYVATISQPVLFGIAAIQTLLLSWYVFRKARWNGSPELLEWRRNLMRARDAFAFQLSRQEPQLKDEWSPYLIAFGLSDALDEWARRFGGDRPADTLSNPGTGLRTSRSAPLSPITIEPRLWTGGGGFGGAGASGSWAGEVRSMASSIAPPSPDRSSGSSGRSSSSSSSSSRSSFSSSRSSSSSSRSGGGGGGGW